MLGLTKVPPSVSLGVTFLIHSGGVIYSLYKTSDSQKKKAAAVE
jgi:hypothetical protein